MPQRPTHSRNANGGATREGGFAVARMRSRCCHLRRRGSRPPWTSQLRRVVSPDQSDRQGHSARSGLFQSRDCFVAHCRSRASVGRTPFGLAVGLLGALAALVASPPLGVQSARVHARAHRVRSSIILARSSDAEFFFFFGNERAMEKRERERKKMGERGGGRGVAIGPAAP